MIKIIDLLVALSATPAATELLAPFHTVSELSANYQALVEESKRQLDNALNEGYSVITATPISRDGITSITYLVHKAAPAASASNDTPARSAGDKEAGIIQMEAGRTKNSASPMWRCTCIDGTRMNVFKHTDAEKNNFVKFEAAGYAPEMEQLMNGRSLYWKASPIRITLRKAGDFWDVVQVQPRPTNAQPDPVLPDEIPF